MIQMTGYLYRLFQTIDTNNTYLYLWFSNDTNNVLFVILLSVTSNIRYK